MKRIANVLGKFSQHKRASAVFVLCATTATVAADPRMRLGRGRGSNSITDSGLTGPQTFFPVVVSVPE